MHVCYQVEVSATGRSLIQRSVSECILENATVRRPRLTRGCRAMKTVLRYFQNLPVRKNNFVQRIKVMMLRLHTY